ncbi:MAG: carbon-nitrogen hydrolase [Peptococcaceae bacterium BICA1-7]|nr:MAG: carbon-nitrogen hydrolase [Peptococcaceae bacterium BICA1-7]HBV98132.1 carbon-nitrogen hydrolase family protein [Desulfotomaculum sp.]
MNKLFRAAVCQMKVTGSKQKNLDTARRMIDRAAEGGAALVALPEMFNCPYVAGAFPEYAEVYPGGETFRMLSTAARENKVYLVGGSVPERDGETVYNSSFVIGPGGDLLGRHRKVHLFDVDLPGGVKVKESSTLGAGRDITIVKTELCAIGVAICYDIRFPELIRLMATGGAEVIVIPAAFNMTTGPAHWDMLHRCRAVDNQLYVIAASPARDARAPYVAYGHSMMVDPWGEIVARAGEEEEIILGDIDPGKIERVRRELPLLRHRRTDLYKLTEV